MTIEEEQVATALFMGAIAIGCFGYLADSSAPLFVVAYVLLGIGGFALHRWRTRASRSGPLDAPIVLAIAFSAQLVMMGVRIFLDGEHATFARTTVWSLCGLSILALAVVAGLALRQRTQKRAVDDNNEGPRESKDVTPLQMAFVLARDTGDMAFVFSALERSRLYVWARKGKDGLVPHLVPSALRERCCISIAEGEEALGDLPPDQIHLIDVRALLSMMTGAWDISITYPYGLDILDADEHPHLRNFIEKADRQAASAGRVLSIKRNGRPCASS